MGHEAGFPILTNALLEGELHILYFGAADAV
jgi:hypothetical protein